MDKGFTTSFCFPVYAFPESMGLTFHVFKKHFTHFWPSVNRVGLRTLIKEAGKYENRFLKIADQTTYLTL